MKPCPNGTYSATALTPNQPGLAASIPSSLVNLVLNDFETFTSTVDDIIEADDTWQYIQDNILDILKEPAQRNLYRDLYSDVDSFLDENNIVSRLFVFCWK